MTPQIFYGTEEKPGLVEYLTVVGTGSVNINTTSDVILRTLGLAQAELELCKAGRPYLNAGSMNLRCRQVAPQVTSTSFRIEATGEVPGQGRRTLRAMVVRQAGQAATRRVTLRSWQWIQDEGTRS